MGNYQRDYQEGRDFEEYVAHCLRLEGYTIRFVRRGVAAQVLVGETYQGLEVKYDRRWRDTGNFYLETQVYAKGAWHPSGISTDVNSLIVVGDKDEFFVLAVDEVRRFADLYEVETRQAGDYPSKGRLLKVGRAKGYALEIYTRLLNAADFAVRTSHRPNERIAECRRCGKLIVTYCPWCKT